MLTLASLRPQWWPADALGSRLAAIQLVNAVGEGSSGVVVVLYLMRARDIDATTTARLLSVAVVAGMVGTLLVGRWSDRFDGRRVLRWCLAGAAVATAGTAAMSTPALLGVTLACTGFADFGASTARNALVAHMAGAQRIRLRALLRSMLNVGCTAGMAVGGLVALTDTSVAYQSALVVDAATFIFAALWARGLPEPEGLPVQPPGQPPSRHAVVRDVRYLVCMVALAFYVVHFEVWGLVLSIWLVGDQGAPPWIVSAGLLVNTGVAAVAQVRAAAGVIDVPTAARAVRRSLIWVVTGFSVVALSPFVPATVFVPVVLLASLSHVVGDMIGSAGHWELTMGLAAPARSGEYLGTAGVLVGGARALAPQLVTVLLVGLGGAGWFILIVMFCVAATAAAASALRAEGRWERQPA